MTATWREADLPAASVLAVVPPDALVAEVVALQGAHGISPSMVPHVTVKAQPGLEDRTHWGPAIGEVVTRTAPFEVELGPPSSFGDDILFLSVRSDDLIRLHVRLLAALAAAGISSRFEYEGDRYEPHLTLAAAFAGATHEQIDAIRAAASARAWPTFLCREIIEFHRARPGDAYRPVDAFALGGAARGSAGSPDGDLT